MTVNIGYFEELKKRIETARGSDPIGGVGVVE